MQHPCTLVPSVISQHCYGHVVAVVVAAMLSPAGRVVYNVARKDQKDPAWSAWLGQNGLPTAYGLRAGY